MRPMKVVAFNGSPRVSGSTHSMNHFFLISQMIIPGANYWNMGYGLGEGDVLKDTEAIETIRALGQNLAWLVKKCAATA